MNLKAFLATSLNHSSCDTVVVEKSIWQGFSEI